ncbi:MAG: arginine--tRNA ligase [Candidatus Moranbacteria bacterium]|nr:arginine--tRNA ligase [Candidatus Moranbacteria bacterium]
MRKELENLLKKAVLELQLGDGTEVTVDYARHEKFGDYSSNVAMVLAKKLGKNPMEVADKISSWLSVHGSQQFEKNEVVKPGYINFYLSKEYLQKKVAEINKLGEKFGASEIGKGIKINNEFISANPTGPLHLGNGRGGFYGDSLSRIFCQTEFAVTNEYYINDDGGQVIKLGHSVLKDSEAVYIGDYIDELNKKYGKLSLEEAGQKSAKYILENIIKKTIEEKMKISFDNWFSEKNLYASGQVDEAVEILKNKNVTYEKDGALWLATSKFGDDKDRVLMKADGQKTYLASDCGYILNKIERKFDKIIEIWGADHHGYINRFKAVAKMLGFSGELKFIIVQLVRLVKNGQEVKMSKRAGNVVYIDELIDKVGQDVARFFFLMYSPDTHMNFDLKLAEEKSQKNPVYYVQYAYARISSILKKIQEHPLPILSLSRERGTGGEGLLIHEKELSLIRELNKFPELVEEIAENYEIHKLPYYAIKLADKFHSFYNECRVIDENNLELTSARLMLVKAVKIVLGETLRLIGVEAPIRM